MIAIRMRFLAGKLHSTPWGHHVNEGVVEYPPSLYRLLRSLVATARRAFLGDVTEAQLRRIATALCAPPEFQLPQAAAAHTRHYDQANGGVKFFDTFVAVKPQDELFWVWPEADLDEADSAVLSKLLTALGTFGRAESWCEAELLGQAEAKEFSANAGRINSRPMAKASSTTGMEIIRLLIPQQLLNAEDLMNVLETETSQMRKDRRLEPKGTRWLTYTRPAGILTRRRFEQKRAKRRSQ